MKGRQARITHNAPLPPSPERFWDVLERGDRGSARKRSTASSVWFAWAGAGSRLFVASSGQERLDVALEACEHPFVTAQGSAYIRFRRALDRGSVTEALSAASELQFVGLAEALELTLLLVDGEPEEVP